MSLPSSPPTSSVYSVEKGDHGWPVFCVQSALNSLRTDKWDRLVADGAFGTLTDTAVRKYQQANSLVVDGKFGPASSKKAIVLLDKLIHGVLPDVPDGVIRGFAEGEGGNVLAAVNWAISGGVDCGIMQYRVYGPPYDFVALQDAFNPLQAMGRAANDFLGRARTFYDAAGVKDRADRTEFSKRLAILAHNWPAGAKDIAFDGKLTNPDGVASWVPAGVKFPDGTPVKTRLEWAQFYALGSSHGKAFIPKYVENWG